MAMEGGHGLECEVGGACHQPVAQPCDDATQSYRSDAFGRVSADETMQGLVRHAEGGGVGGGVDGRSHRKGACRITGQQVAFLEDAPGRALAGYHQQMAYAVFGHAKHGLARGRAFTDGDDPSPHDPPEWARVGHAPVFGDEAGDVAFGDDAFGAGRLAHQHRRDLRFYHTRCRFAQ